MKYGMKILGAIMVAHWFEHIFQAYQVYVLHMPRACALGLLGIKYPWLVRTESLHFAFALLTYAAIIVAGWHYFESPVATRIWAAGVFASAWHFFEHTLLFWQGLTGEFLFGATQPTSIIQLIVPRIELHLFYNSIITALVLFALWEESMYRDVMEFKKDHDEHCEFCR